MIGAGIKAYQIGQRSPQRFFEQAGGTIKKEIYDPIQDGHDKIIREMWERFRPRFFSWKKEGNGDRVGYYLFNKDEQARKILSKQGINIDKEVMKLTPKELEHANEIQGYFEELFHRVNAARIQSGMKPMAKRSNYITFFRQMDWMKENLGYDIFNRADLDKDIAYRFVDFNSTIFKHAKERGKDEGIPIATDAYKIFMKYANSALDHINLTPPISRGQRLNLQLAKSDPKLHAEINHWLNFVAGKEDHPDGFFTKPLWDLVHTLNRNAAFGVVALSARTIWNQGTAGIITVTETG